MWLVFTLALFGNTAEVMETYRTQGLDAAEALLDEKLGEAAYWRERLADINTTYGFYETPKDVMVCDKNATQFVLFRYRTGTLERISEYNATVGEIRGDKQEEGDLRTPVGVYDLTSKLKEVDPFYGPFAYVTSYPNLLDKKMDKNGHGIWVHGFPLNGDRTDRTKGCIALKNHNLTDLDQHLDYKHSILMVNEAGVMKAKKEEIARIIAMLYRWRNAWKNGDIEAYLSFYHPEFTRYDGMKRKQFVAMKRYLFNRVEKKEILVRNLEVIPYPNSYGKKLYRVRFHESYRAPNHRFDGTKELYVVVAPDGETILLER